MCPVSVAIGSDVSKQTCEIDVWLAVTLVGDGCDLGRRWLYPYHDDDIICLYTLLGWCLNHLVYTGN